MDFVAFLQQRFQQFLNHFQTERKKSESVLELDQEMDELKEFAKMHLVRYRPESLDKLVKKTKFDKKEIKLLYRRFKQSCPSGIVGREDFKEYFTVLIPYADGSDYADLVFNTFDLDRNNNISFDEFVYGLSVISRGSIDEKLNWVFTLYDGNGNDSISAEELRQIVKSIYELMGVITKPPYTQELIVQHADEIFQILDVNNDGYISREEFVDCLKTTPYKTPRHLSLWDQCSTMMDPWIDYSFSIDLVAAAQYHYDFVQLVDFVYPQLYQPDVLKRAIRRYEVCWMGLKSSHPEKQLIPPIDVHWIWHIHMLSEHDYAADCAKLTKSDVVDRPFAPLKPELFQQIEAESRQLWSTQFPADPYDFELTLLTPVDNCYQQVSQMNFMEAIVQQREFNYKVSFPHFKSAQFLKKATQRYRKWLYLQHKYPTNRLAPTCVDIELIWHTHKTHPVGYVTDLKTNLGSEVAKMMSSNITPMSNDTAELWKETFGESMLAPGCLPRSYPSQKGLDSYVPTKRWNDFDANYYLTTLRTERFPSDKEALMATFFTEDFNGSRTDFGSAKLSRNHRDQFEDFRPNLTIRPSVLGAPLLLELTPAGHRGVITTLMGKKKSSAVYRSSCNVRDLLPRSMLGSSSSLNLPIFNLAGDMTDAFLQVNATVKSVAEFDLVFGNFCDTIMTESGTPALYNRCLHAALNQQSFKDYPRALVSDHILNERRTIKSYLCQVIHSAPAVLSSILIYSNDQPDEIVVSAQLVGPEYLPDLEDVEKTDKGLLALGPNERAMVIRNKYGDFALIKSQWMKSKTELDHNLESKIVPGQLVIWIHVLNRSVPDKAIFSMINHQSSVIDLKGAKLNLYDRTIRVESNWVLEQVCLMLSAGVLYNLCQPSRASQPYEMRWPLMLMCGYGGELPSNRYFDYCSQHTDASSRDLDERSTNSSRSSSGYDSIHGAQHCCPMWSSLTNFPPLLPWQDEVNQVHMVDTKTHSSHQSSPASSIRNGLENKTKLNTNGSSSTPKQLLPRLAQ